MYALKEVKNGYHLYYCDAVADIEDLPTANTPDANGVKCPAFSEALVVADGSVYILTKNTDTWTKL